MPRTNMLINQQITPALLLQIIHGRRKPTLDSFDDMNQQAQATLVGYHYLGEI